MASGTGSTRKPASSGIAKSAAQHKHIEAIIHNGGQIMIGTIKPIEHAALAHDGQNTVAMLRCKSNESLNNILDRLEAAIASAETTGRVVDEINRSGADRTYKY